MTTTTATTGTGVEHGNPDRIADAPQLTCGATRFVPVDGAALRPAAACRDALFEAASDSPRDVAALPRRVEQVVQRHAAAYRDAYAEWSECDGEADRDEATSFKVQ